MKRVENIREAFTSRPDVFFNPIRFQQTSNYRYWKFKISIQYSNF